MTGFSKSIQLVGNGEYWVAKQHPRTGVTHDLPSLVSSRWFVTVNRAVGAGWFFVAIRAFLQPNLGVVEKTLAPWTQLAS
jgi:hypothetical protein